MDPQYEKNCDNCELMSNLLVMCFKCGNEMCFLCYIKALYNGFVTCPFCRNKLSFNSYHIKSKLYKPRSNL
jgi:hypothetical protein